MATITREGAPGKDTVGQIGDICTDSLTLREFECVAIYTTTTNERTTVEYDWYEIYSSNTEGGSEADAAKIRELQEKNAELSIANSNLTSANKTLTEKNSELETELDDINAALEEIIGGV